MSSSAPLARRLVSSSDRFVSDRHGGFAQWSGSSFSAPALAARFLKAVAETAKKNGSQGGVSWLEDVSAPTTTQRASGALGDIGWEGD